MGRLRTLGASTCSALVSHSSPSMLVCGGKQLPPEDWIDLPVGTTFDAGHGVASLNLARRHGAAARPQGQNHRKARDFESFAAALQSFSIFFPFSSGPFQPSSWPGLGPGLPFSTHCTAFRHFRNSPRSAWHSFSGPVFFTPTLASSWLGLCGCRSQLSITLRPLVC